MKWYLSILVFLVCSCVPSNNIELPTVPDQNLLAANEAAHERSTGTSALTAPCKAYVETVPGVPVWPGVRIGGLYTEKDIINPPVDIEEDFKKRMLKHRMEQRIYWTAKLNKGIFIGLAIAIIGLIINFWAKLPVGIRIAMYGVAFSCFCIACQWYFDYIPYIALACVGYIAIDMIWSIYQNKRDKKVKDELAGTVETVKEKIRNNGLGHIWSDVKNELAHSKDTIKHVAEYKKS